MKIARTLFTVLFGMILGMGLMSLLRPQPIKAQSGQVFTQSVSPQGSYALTGSTVVGFSCMPSGGYCVILSR